jgi:hypothetical protein
LEEGEARGVTRGAVNEARKVLRIQGDEAFGLPDERTAALIEQIDDLPRLEELLRRLLTSRSWQELLGEPTPKPRSRRRRSS